MVPAIALPRGLSDMLDLIDLVLDLAARGIDFYRITLHLAK